MTAGSLRNGSAIFALTVVFFHFPLRICEAATARTGNVVMGTVLQITVVHAEAERARELADRSFDIARHWDDVLTTWRRSGELARLNARAGKGPAAVSADLHAALGKMLELSGETGGAFDPAVGPLVERLRNAAADGPETDSATAAPDANAPALHIASALRLSPGHAELLAGARIDAGGIGKGIALDAIDAFLKDSGATSWFLDFGGSSQLGFAPEGSGSNWRVAVAGLQTGTLRGSVGLIAGSLSTSRALPAGDAAGSIVDPRTGRAVPPPILATVHAADAARAEAWSTALVVLGPPGMAAANEAGVSAILETAALTLKSTGFPKLSAIGSAAAPPTPAAE